MVALRATIANLLLNLKTRCHPEAAAGRRRTSTFSPTKTSSVVAAIKHRREYARPHSANNILKSLKLFPVGPVTTASSNRAKNVSASLARKNSAASIPNSPRPRQRLTIRHRPRRKTIPIDPIRPRDSTPPRASPAIFSTHASTNAEFLPPTPGPVTGELTSPSAINATRLPAMRRRKFLQLLQQILRRLLHRPIIRRVIATRDKSSSPPPPDAPDETNHPSPAAAKNAHSKTPHRPTSASPSSSPHRSTAHTRRRQPRPQLILRQSHPSHPQSSSDQESSAPTPAPPPAASAHRSPPA